MAVSSNARNSASEIADSLAEYVGILLIRRTPSTAREELNASRLVSYQACSHIWDVLMKEDHTVIARKPPSPEQVLIIS